MNRTLVDYYRCPEEFARCVQYGDSPSPMGYFRFGAGATCYGSITKCEVHPNVTNELHDAFNDALVQPGTLRLSFDPDQAVDNLRLERYCGTSPQPHTLHDSPLIRNLYYLVRPILGVSVRRHMQRLRLRGWRSISFPSWPVDRTVELLHETLLCLHLQSHKGAEIPFIWFWPKGLSSCVTVTHDVETAKGRDFCPALMDLDESFGIKSSFQLIPEGRYSVSTSLLERIRSRGFEVNIHDLNHDGHLFDTETQFLRRARRINQYGREYGAKGFRAGALYRHPDWYGALDFSYEMSVPNTAHLDPQRGGCCTVMPYFIGNLLEIPLTTTQDYSLFHILNDYSIALWQQQLDLIGQSHGIATFNIHPDYVIDPKPRATYVQLLEHLARLCSERKIWLALPGEVDSWWRSRAQMRIVRRHDEWTIEGPNSERAHLAYARLGDHGIEYSWTAAGPQRRAGDPATALGA